ncbi:MAG: hypothetical protein QOK28_3354 [Actinomycetota bacterium]|jgi:hypothetical protein
MAERPCDELSGRVQRPIAGKEARDASVSAPKRAALAAGKAIFHHDALEVVGLVLQATAEFAGAVNLDAPAELILSFRHRGTGPT